MAIIKHGNNALSNITALPSAVPTGKPVLLSTATASSSASIEFTSGIDSTYDIYKFEFINILPATDSTQFMVNYSTDSGSNYNVTKTSTFFLSRHAEDDSSSELSYKTGQDLAQSTSNQMLTVDSDNNSDSSQSGYLYLFAPSSSVYVKHWISRVQGVQTNQHSMENYTAGYCNTTSAVDAIRFTISSGNISSGTIKMYGISA